MKNSNDTIGNRTRDFLTCSAVPQPTAPPRAHIDVYIHLLNSSFLDAAMKFLNAFLFSIILLLSPNTED